MQVYVNGEQASARPLREEELGLLVRIRDGVQRVFLFLEGPPCRGGDNITCDPPPPGVDEVWIRFPCRRKDGSIFYGNMRIFPGS